MGFDARLDGSVEGNMDETKSAHFLTRRAALAFSVAAPIASAAQGGGEKPVHPVVFFEIGCRDLAKSQQFYQNLFGWKTQANGLAATIDLGTKQGVPGQMVSLGHEPQHYMLFYVEVEEIQPYLDKAIALGGKVLVPGVKIPTGMFAWVADVDGNMVGLLKKS
jgi:predicted enzyme related to lactoylglutathione lyase